MKISKEQQKSKSVKKFKINLDSYDVKKRNIYEIIEKQVDNQKNFNQLPSCIQNSKKKQILQKQNSFKKVSFSLGKRKKQHEYVKHNNLNSSVNFYDQKNYLEENFVKKNFFPLKPSEKKIYRNSENQKNFNKRLEKNKNYFFKENRILKNSNLKYNLFNNQNSFKKILTKTNDFLKIPNRNILEKKNQNVLTKKKFKEKKSLSINSYIDLYSDEKEKQNLEKTKLKIGNGKVKENLTNFLRKNDTLNFFKEKLSEKQNKEIFDLLEKVIKITKNQIEVF